MITNSVGDKISASLRDLWINAVVNCQVQEIELEVGIAEEDPFSRTEENSSLDAPSFGSEENPSFELPQCVFGSKTVRVLELELQYKRLKEPAGVFAYLQDLCLHSMLGSDSENALKKLISTSWPSLLTLVSMEGIKTLRINHSRWCCV
ncbi:unnamed protein product [Dovyalis caffra]|uniref:Uncharacterized protein n=1 Tax=Dovyalis caffra TaxID=77055 RepID=A0AAV1R9F5_9ROSI|nr:unnamed protein product [Dovyalis caffra]